MESSTNAYFLTTQNQRETTLAGFRGGQFNVLVATDVAARGLDINGVELVLQIEPPKDPETYIHRSGTLANLCMVKYTQTYSCIVLRSRSPLSFVVHKLFRTSLSWTSSISCLHPTELAIFLMQGGRGGRAAPASRWSWLTGARRGW